MDNNNNNNNQITEVKTSIDVAEWKAKRDTLLAEAKTVVQVTDNTELEKAGAVEAGLKKLISKLSARRKEVTSPIDELKKSIMAEEKRLAKPLEDEVARVNKMTSAYANEIARRIREEDKAREAAEREAAEREAAGLEPSDAIAPSPISTPHLHTSSNRFVETWEFEITSPRIVPHELCSPDEKKIRAFMNERKAEGYKVEDLVVDGIKFSSTIKVQSKA